MPRVLLEMTITGSRCRVGTCACGGNAAWMYSTRRCASVRLLYARKIFCAPLCTQSRALERSARSGLHAAGGGEHTRGSSLTPLHHAGGRQHTNAVSMCQTLCCTLRILNTRRQREGLALVPQPESQSAPYGYRPPAQPFDTGQRLTIL
jgi:hypothetical protein